MPITTKRIIWCAPIVFAFLLSFPSEAVEPDVQYYPMVQTHKLDFRPHLPLTFGYALFLGSVSFTGKEKVTVRTPKGVEFPDLNTDSRRLSAFQSYGMWYENDAERAKSGVSAELPPGKYSFEIELTDGKKVTQELEHHPHYLEPASEIEIDNTDDRVLRAKWRRPEGANSFMVCLLPVPFKDLILELVPVSTAFHGDESISLDKKNIKPGKYYVAVRSNHFWDRGTSTWAIGEESWGVSKDTFSIKRNEK